MRRFRLPSSKDFDRVLRHRTIASRRGACRLYAAPNDLGAPRLGFIISKRAVKSAVRRNRLKRLVRESFRLRADELPALDVVVQFTGDVDDADVRSIFAEMWTQLAQRGGSVSEPR